MTPFSSRVNVPSGASLYRAAQRIAPRGRLTNSTRACAGTGGRAFQLRFDGPDVTTQYHYYADVAGGYAQCGRTVFYCRRRTLGAGRRSDYFPTDTPIKEYENIVIKALKAWFENENLESHIVEEGLEQ